MKLPPFVLVVMGLYVANILAMPIDTNENETRDEDGTEGEEACCDPNPIVSKDRKPSFEVFCLTCT
jgi:hypothetical protein